MWKFRLIALGKATRSSCYRCMEQRSVSVKRVITLQRISLAYLFDIRGNASYYTIKRAPLHLLVGTLLILFFTGCTATVGSSMELEGNLTVSGSTALQPLASAAAALFQKQH